MRGVHMGRPRALNRDQQREAIARRDAGEALTDIARTFGVSHTTISRLRASTKQLAQAESDASLTLGHNLIAKQKRSQTEQECAR